jgi:lysozyme
MILGIDYAQIDGNRTPNFPLARSAGIDFLYARATVGRSVDPTFARDRDAATRVGIHVGAFMALDWSGDPAAQAKIFASALGPIHPGDLPPAIDVEMSRGIAATGLAPSAAIQKIEIAIRTLQVRCPTVLLYTSARVWHEDLADLPSPLCSTCPLWIKVPYPWNPRNPPHPESIPPVGSLPLPWQGLGSAGAWIEQFQGDAVGLPGLTATVDLNAFLSSTGDSHDPRAAWISQRITNAGISSTGTIQDKIRAFQGKHRLDTDGIVGPATWSALCAA